MEKQIHTPLTKDKMKDLKAGDYVCITGIIYSARDAAHKRMYEAVMAGEDLPFSIKDNIIYYMGPSPARSGQIIGSAGPTTASRMDKYTPRLLDMGLSGMIGKGIRSKEVVESIIKNKAVYFAATGGAGALLSKCIKKSKVIAYDELGTEAVHELYVESFPVIVAIDSKGNNLYNQIS
ncbi:MAG TPA: Fe-S-containing hydro-lyase [Clostridiales bacterium]|jgi:fumarate hydratase subunit beta|nr:Fe-S-containing hydro-lyase [Clostridiales bacterium]